MVPYIAKGPATSAGQGVLYLLLFFVTTVAFAAPPIEETASNHPTLQAANRLTTSWQPTYGDTGGVGLLQMPSARMRDDGRLHMGFSRIHPYDRFFLTMQALPWLEGTFRITQITNRIEGSSLTFNDTAQNFFDRGIDVKVRLLQEGPHWPDLSVGLRDIGGTGLFSSEYIVASRRYYNWDITAGIGWGNLATGSNISNPLADVVSSFGERSSEIGDTGVVNTDFFRGENIGIFGGVE